MKRLDRPATLPEHLRDIWDEMVDQVRPAIGSAGLEALCAQIWLARDARSRIERDGTIVQDAKGNPIEHPALGIERKAQAEIRTWLGKYGVR